MADISKLNIADHAREIAFAVFRVSKLIEQPKLKSFLESAAVELVSECGNVPFVSYVPNGTSLPYLPYLEKLTNLVLLAESIGEIKPVNAKVLSRELAALKSAIAESVSATYSTSEKAEEINLEDIFKKEDNVIPSGAVIPSSARNPRDDNREPQFKLPRTIKIPEAIQAPAQQLQATPVVEINFDNALTRQSAILEFIKQLPNGCRMKDLMAKFPSVSERTLRNDLQVLTTEDKIERFGAIQGPFSYFRAKSQNRPPELLETVTKNETISL